MIEKILKFGPLYGWFLKEKYGGKYEENDLFCCAAFEALKNKKDILVDFSKHACKGGDYFVANKKVSQEKLREAYIKKECVFRTKNDLNKFLKTCGKNPKRAKYLFLSLKKKTNLFKPDFVLGICETKEVGRFLGIGAYLGKTSVDLIPAAPTCASLFRPLLRLDSLHVNFIDYFDRDYRLKKMVEDGEMIVSLNFDLYKKMDKVFNKTCHGGKILKNFKNL